MKIQCEHCGGDLTKTVRSAFARYDAGPLECPDCHAFQSRSLTPADFLIDQLTTLSCMLGLILLLPVFAQIQSELRAFVNLLLLGGGILVLDQFRFLLYCFPPVVARPYSPQKQLKNQHRFNFMRLIGISALVFSLVYFRTLSSVIVVLIVCLIYTVFRLLMLFLHRAMSSK